MKAKEPFLLKICRKSKIFYSKTGFNKNFIIRNSNLNSRENSLIFSAILNNTSGLMFTKIGTVELENYCCLKKFIQHDNSFFETISTYLKDIYFACRNLKNFDWSLCFNTLVKNAGFFPNDITDGIKWAELVSEDIKAIDFFVTYQKLETYIKQEILSLTKINFYSLLAPFLVSNPWTAILENKNILIIHPFVETIRKQYENNRIYLFSNPKVLPKFKKLYTIRAVQSIAENKTEFTTWFNALDYMKSEIDKIPDFDIALIGCGAYGIHLAAYCKKKGKIGIHMASYVQILFGIYGHRWENDIIISPFINNYWVRPSENERPNNYKEIENGCYW